MNESENSKNKTIDASIMTSFDHLIINANIATFSAHYGFDMYENEDADSVPYGQLENAAIGIKNGKIAWIGAQDQITAHLPNYQDAPNHRYKW